MTTDKLMRDDWLTLEQVERIVANHESGVQLCQVELYRQLADAMRENERLRRALWYISVNSMPPGPDWCEVPERVSRYAAEALQHASTLKCPHGWAWGLSCGECSHPPDPLYTGSGADAALECSEEGIERRNKHPVGDK